MKKNEYTLTSYLISLASTCKDHWQLLSFLMIVFTAIFSHIIVSYVFSAWGINVYDYIGFFDVYLASYQLISPDTSFLIAFMVLFSVVFFLFTSNLRRLIDNFSGEWMAELYVIKKIAGKLGVVKRLIEDDFKKQIPLTYDLTVEFNGILQEKDKISKIINLVEPEIENITDEITQQKKDTVRAFYRLIKLDKRYRNLLAYTESWKGKVMLRWAPRASMIITLLLIAQTIYSMKTHEATYSFDRYKFTLVYGSNNEKIGCAYMLLNLSEHILINRCENSFAPNLEIYVIDKKNIIMYAKVN